MLRDPLAESLLEGEKIGSVSIDWTGRRTNVSADLNASCGDGNTFEGWLVDAGGSEYRLILGQFRNGTLDFSQYTVNSYTYKNFEISEELFAIAPLSSVS